MANNDKQQAGNNYFDQRTSGMQNQLRDDTSGREKIGTAARTTFDVIVDGVAYLVQAAAFTFNGEKRFYVSINNGEDHVFTWDSQVSGFRAINDESVVIPDTVEEAINRELQLRM